MVYSKHPISLIPIGHVTGIHSENLFYALRFVVTQASNHVIKDGVMSMIEGFINDGVL
jgi:thiamine pyrophosphokinase